MKRGSHVRALLAGIALLAAAGCGATDPDSIEQVQGEITGGWQLLSLRPGWFNYNGTSNPPAVGKVNGVLTFRGAMNGTSSGTTHAFNLPAGFLPANPNTLNMRIVLANNKGGALVIRPPLPVQGSPTEVHVYEDGVPPSGPPGPNAFFTSLDGASVDETASDATSIVLDGTPDGNWVHLYGHRHQGNEIAAVSAKTVGGFVRFQGFLMQASGGSPTSTFLFNLPSQFRPGQSVFVPVVLCPGGNGSAQQTYGRINILAPSGDVYVQPENGNIAAAKCGVSFEGASYSLSSTTQTLNFQNGWISYSARPVRVRNSGGVIRFQGAVKNGTANTIANNLPVSMRPPVNVYLQADSWGAARARIVVTPAGVVYFDTPSLSVAQGFLSLDSVSYGLP